jgi:sodium transport system permease protein
MIFTIFKKELKDTLRDRRTMMMMIVIPILVFPLIMNIFIGISSSYHEEAATKSLKIGVVGNKGNYVFEELKNIPSTLGKKEVIYYKDTLQLISDLKKDSLQLGIFTSPNFNTNWKEKTSSEVTVYFNATDVGMQERGESYMEFLQNKAQKTRYKELNIDEKSITPIITNYRNIASDKEMVGKLAGGILPYIFIAFGFIGCMYPAIDLFTGEKERGTIETLLTTPVARWQILYGKMGVVVLS